MDGASVSNARVKVEIRTSIHMSTVHLLYEGGKNNSCQLVAVEEEEEENEERVDGRLKRRRGEETVSTPWPIALVFWIDGPR